MDKQQSLRLGLTVLIISVFLYFFIQRTDPEEVQPSDWRVTFEQPRSPKWSDVRAAYVRQNPRCVACGTNKNLNVHHIKPFHTNPELELDISNLITLCREHHFTIGHKSNWKNSNPNVREDCRKFQSSNENNYK